MICHVGAVNDVELVDVFRIAELQGILQIEEQFKGFPVDEALSIERKKVFEYFRAGTYHHLVLH
jgi:hypothetical protein